MQLEILLILRKIYTHGGATGRQIIKLTIEGEDWIIFGFQSKLKTN